MFKEYYKIVFLSYGSNINLFFLMLGTKPRAVANNRTRVPLLRCVLSPAL